MATVWVVGVLCWSASAVGGCAAARIRLCVTDKSEPLFHPACRRKSSRHRRTKPTSVAGRNTTLTNAMINSIFPFRYKMLRYECHFKCLQKRKSSERFNKTRPLILSASRDPVGPIVPDSSPCRSTRFLVVLLSPLCCAVSTLKRQTGFVT